MAKQENEFLYGLVRFAVTVLLLGLVILWVRSGGPTIEAVHNHNAASTSAADAH